ncbi:MAG TPA: helix-turn-helix transcriptional regulator [Pyrinomonadaceae bacterium]|jgi:transcriptional regulator with XRE-family HTH domain
MRELSAQSLSLLELGTQVKIHREQLGISQDALADQVGSPVNRSNIAHLEQGRRLPVKETLQKICEGVNLPKGSWQHFANPLSINRLNFEVLLQELVGSYVSLINLDESIIRVLEQQIDNLFKGTLSNDQSLECLNSISVFYGTKPLSKPFFERYISQFINSLEYFEIGIKNYQKDAIRLFSTIQESYLALNTENEKEFNNLLAPLVKRDTSIYTTRTEWDKINKISNEKLPYLGYIAASRVKKEEAERRKLSDFLLEIASKKRTKTFDLNDYPTKTKKRMDSWLREFNSKIEHGLFSPLFNPDIETLEKEAEYISPKFASNLEIMEETQKEAYDNLSNYLTSDYMDVYVATSMRNDADFISVNDFVENLFENADLKRLKLRYFNPTQSWIEDRVAKGLVEALMLKRADLCIYMAQKEDTFGKDSEASVTLGQGKPVIVYVPKLEDKEADIDTELFGKLERSQLINKIKELSDEEIDDFEDNESLHSTLLSLKLDKLTIEDYIRIVKKHWADFDLESEFTSRIGNEDDKQKIKLWFTAILQSDDLVNLEEPLINELIRTLVAVSMRFERRAKVFREVHPLALQVILSTGVLNGILVVRSVNTCARVVNALITNDLELELETDYKNYKLIEKNTKSTIRVISKHRLISNAFKTYYRK